MLKLIGIAAWAVAHPALYGYHLASLNGIQDVAVCPPMQADETTTGTLGLRECLDVDDAQFGSAVTIITLGGLIGSLSADIVIRRYGRNNTLRIAQAGMILGGIGVGLANDVWLLAAGRLLIGLASGLIMVSIPPFLSCLSHSHRKLLGSLHQICIGVGMIVAQSLSLVLGRQPSPTATAAAAASAGISTVPNVGWGLWRSELLIAVILALALALLGLGVDADDERAVEDRSAVAGSAKRGDEERPLLGERGPSGSDANEAGRRSRYDSVDTHAGQEEQDHDGSNGSRDGPVRRSKQLGIREVFSGDTKFGAIIVVVALCAQQITGISPVMFFSSKILKSTFGGESKLVALSMMAVGIPFNFLPGLLKMESRKTLLISATGTTLFSLLLALGLNTHSQSLSGIAVIGFVIAFSFGLAPVPWVVLSEVVPAGGRTAVGSVGVGINWATNLILGSTFIPLQGLLHAEGDIFYIFAALSALALTLIWASYRMYERQLDQQQKRKARAGGNYDGHS